MHVDSAEDGSEACIKIGLHKPDFLLLDMQMPNMDGIDVLKTLSKDKNLAHIKVLIITGFPENPDLKAAQVLGYTRVHHKPVVLKEILLDIMAILDMPNAQ